MNYASQFTPLFLRHLKRLDKRIRERVLEVLEEILDEPRRGSQLVYSQQVAFKWRVGDYRIIYAIDERRRIVTFVVVDHRSRVYRRYRR